MTTNISLYTHLSNKQPTVVRTHSVSQYQSMQCHCEASTPLPMSGCFPLPLCFCLCVSLSVASSFPLTCQIISSPVSHFPIKTESISQTPPDRSASPVITMPRPALVLVLLLSCGQTLLVLQDKPSLPLTCHIQLYHVFTLSL